MNLGALALVLAAGAAGWLLWRSARGRANDARSMTILKGVAFLGLAAALFAAKLWPLAFMTLVAAGAIAAIEAWRDRTVRLEEAASSGSRPAKIPMQADEAASVLGISVDASPDEIRAAHKKLISQLHPDKGGTDYLAAKINDARDVLLTRKAPNAS